MRYLAVVLKEREQVLIPQQARVLSLISDFEVVFEKGLIRLRTQMETSFHQNFVSVVRYEF